MAENQCKGRGGSRNKEVHLNAHICGIGLNPDAGTGWPPFIAKGGRDALQIKIRLKKQKQKIKVTYLD